MFSGDSKEHPYCLENPSGIITREDLIEHFSHDNFLLSKRGSSLRALSDELFDNYSFSPIAVCAIFSSRQERVATIARCSSRGGSKRLIASIVFVEIFA